MNYFKKVILVLFSSLFLYSDVEAETMQSTIIQLQDDNGEPLVHYPFIIHSNGESIEYQTTDDGYAIIYQLTEEAVLQIHDSTTPLSHDEIQTFEVSSPEEEMIIEDDDVEDYSIQLLLIDEMSLPIETGEVSLIQDDNVVDKQMIKDGKVTFEPTEEGNYEVQYEDQLLEVMTGEVRYFKVEPVVETETPSPIASNHPARYRYPKTSLKRVDSNAIQPSKEKVKKEEEKDKEKEKAANEKTMKQEKKTNVTPSKKNEVITKKEEVTSLPIQKPTKSVEQRDDSAEEDNEITEELTELPSTEPAKPKTIKIEDEGRQITKKKPTPSLASSLPDTGETFIYNGWVVAILFAGCILICISRSYKKKNLPK